MSWMGVRQLVTVGRTRVENEAHFYQIR